MEKNFFHRGVMMFAVIVAASMVLSCSDDNVATPDAGITEQPEVPKPEVPQPEAVSVKLDREVETSGMYFGNFWKEGYANYYFELADGEVGFIESTGKTAPLNAGNYIFCFDMWGALSADHAHAILPEGVYHANDGRKDGCFDVKNTLAVYNAGKEGNKFKINHILFNEGTIEVKHVREGYDIKADLVASDGTNYSFTYTGQVTFSDQSSDEKEKWEIGEDVLLAPIYATKVVVPGEKQDNCVLRFFDTRNVTPDGLHVNEQGTKFELTLNVAKDGDLAGKYLPGKGVGTFTAGQRIGKFPAGTFCERVNSDMTITNCVMNQGSVEITSHGDGTHTFDVNLTSVDGFKVSGKWTIKLEKLTTPPQTTLTGDVVCNPLTCTQVMYLGDYYGNSTSNYMVFLETDTELVAFDILAAQSPTDSQTFPTGTFKMSDTKTAGSLLPGDVSEGKLTPSGYVKYDLETMAAAAAAPFVGGELTVTKSGEQYTFTYAVYDDFNKDDANLQPHRISGTWTGTLPKMTTPSPMQAKRALN